MTYYKKCAAFSCLSLVGLLVLYFAVICIFNPLAYTAGCETQFRDQPNITAQEGYVLKSIKINFA